MEIEHIAKKKSFWFMNNSAIIYIVEHLYT